MRTNLLFRYPYAVFAIALLLFFPRPAGAGLININTATQQQLDGLPNIGPSRARAIVSYREAHGPFKHKEDLRNVHGIGKGIYSGLKDSITVGAGAEAEVRATAKKAAPAPPPKVYTEENYVKRSCWSCKNKIYVPQELKKGWCPFCGKQWSVK